MNKSTLLVLLLFVGTTIPVRAQKLSDQAISIIDRAMGDELDRSKSQLKLNGLIDPFFISYSVSDNHRLDIVASFGALTRSAFSHQRQLNLRLLINNYQLNDENFGDAGGGIFGGGTPIDMNLPLDDDYNTIRRAFWLATDDLFKEANETFTKKKAALERKQLTDEDRDLPDFAKAPKVEVIEPPADIQINKAKLEGLIRDLSAIFSKYKPIQNCNVSLASNNSYLFLKNTEGTNLRKPETTCDLTIQASAQAADDGEPLSLSISFSARSPELLPDRALLMEKTENLAQSLVALTTAAKFDGKEYTGPVLFEGDAGSDFISEQIVAKLSAQREDVLGGGSVFSLVSKGPTFQKKIGTRVLPASMSLRDIPLVKPKSGLYLGNYSVDEDGVVPGNLTLVENGILKTLYMTRTPTKEVKEPNGHTRPYSGGIGSGTTAGPGVVEITDKKAVRSSQMRKDLLKRAQEDGYEYAFIVRSLEKGSLIFSEGMGNIGDMLESGKSLSPALVYQVSTKDGTEKLVRGTEISFPTARDLREIITSKETVTKDMGLAAGSGGSFFSFGGKVPATLIGPESVMVPELEVRKKKTSANPTKPVVEKP
ncbi:MAG: metallopeptidase TldD-related protein [Bacteroidota bacterium]|nr:metallopeptidase TldD-related protein [Bacteroidota bacterium]